LEGIKNLLSHLHLEVSSLEACTAEVLTVLRSLRGSAQVDELTGLLRRKPFFDKWNQLLAECDALNAQCGVMLIDVDHFKRVNDTFGHMAGDEVLARVGDLLRQFENPNCVAGRFGGEEFVLALRGTPEEMKFTAEQIRKRMERTKFSSPDGEVFDVTVSVGIAVGADPSKTLQAADEALYAAKESGRNKVEVA
jgi:diguanylate cyclase (GGDEF)-like protein